LKETTSLRGSIDENMLGEKSNKLDSCLNHNNLEEELSNQKAIKVIEI